MNPDSLQKLREYGYSKTEANFLELVALHSGLFLRRHYLVFSGLKTGSLPSSFLQRLAQRGHVRLFKLAKNARIYHLHSRQIYDALRLSNLRHRRRHGIDYVKTKLLIMDYVLENPALRYLPTEEDKLEFFVEKVKIPIADLPQRTYLTPNSKEATTRYFVEKFPITILSNVEDQLQVTFHYVDPGPYLGIADFENFLRHYQRLFSHFNPLRLVYVHQKISKLPAAERLFATFNLTIQDKGGELIRYFSLREKWEAGQYQALSQADLRFLTLAKNRFKGKECEEKYIAWKSQKEQTCDRLEHRQVERQFIPYKVGGSYDFFGELE